MIGKIMMFAGVVVIILAILNYFDIPIEFPTSSAMTNAAIGGGLIVAPYAWKRL